MSSSSSTPAVCAPAPLINGGFDASPDSFLPWVVTVTPVALLSNQAASSATLVPEGYDSTPYAAYPFCQAYADPITVTISQEIATIPGTIYDVYFAYNVQYNPVANPYNYLVVKADGNEIQNIALGDPDNRGIPPYTWSEVLATDPITATDISTLLEFDFYCAESADPEHYNTMAWLFDQVSVVPRNADDCVPLSPTTSSSTTTAASTTTDIISTTDMSTTTDMTTTTEMPTTTEMTATTEITTTTVTTTTTTSAIDSTTTTASTTTSSVICGPTSYVFTGVDGGGSSFVANLKIDRSQPCTQTAGDGFSGYSGFQVISLTGAYPSSSNQLGLEDNGGCLNVNDYPAFGCAGLQFTNFQGGFNLHNCDSSTPGTYSLLCLGGTCTTTTITETTPLAVSPDDNSPACPGSTVTTMSTSTSSTTESLTTTTLDITSTTTTDQTSTTSDTTISTTASSSIATTSQTTDTTTTATESTSQSSITSDVGSTTSSSPSATTSTISETTSSASGTNSYITICDSTTSSQTSTSSAMQTTSSLRTSESSDSSSSMSDTSTSSTETISSTTSGASTTSGLLNTSGVSASTEMSSTPSVSSSTGVSAASSVTTTSSATSSLSSSSSGTAKPSIITTTFMTSSSAASAITTMSTSGTTTTAVSFLSTTTTSSQAIGPMSSGSNPISSTSVPAKNMPSNSMEGPGAATISTTYTTTQLTSNPTASPNAQNPASTSPSNILTAPDNPGQSSGITLPSMTTLVPPVSPNAQGNSAPGASTSTSISVQASTSSIPSGAADNTPGSTSASGASAPTLSTSIVSGTSTSTPSGSSGPGIITSNNGSKPTVGMLIFIAMGFMLL